MTGCFQTLEFLGEDIPPYAFFSHTWEDDEVLFGDISASNLTASRRKRGWHKLVQRYRQACKDGCQWCWIDTCCIDKTPSAETFEAINTIFRWYQKAMVCYAYLAEVRTLQDSETVLDNLGAQNSEVGSDQSCVVYQTSKWFSCGWTLQELIAPMVVRFFGYHWCYLADKSSHLLKLSRATSIDELTLNHTTPLSKIFEDKAHCLLGENAFSRLQEEIIRFT
ncbi:heterokaryon incompatibility protein-domain-containing protein [Xylariaceae sp. FL0016]|nr:heterokaryon incompatibility protein-domain-containing protein [Xylariaceae sp. FL0016]